MRGPLDFMLKLAEEIGTEPLTPPEEELPPEAVAEQNPEEVAEQVDLSQLSDEELAALAAAAQAEGEPDESEIPPEEEMAVPEEMAEKLSSLHDFFGRIQLHGFMDEMRKVAAEESSSKEEKKKEEKDKESMTPDEITKKVAALLAQL